MLRQGFDATLIALGDMVSKALEAHNILKEEGIGVRVLDMHTVKPIDKEAVIKAAVETGAIVTVEDHNIINGLGGAVAEVIVENELVPVKRIGLQDTFAESGEYEKLLTKYKMNVVDIINAVKLVIGRKKYAKK